MRRNIVIVGTGNFGKMLCDFLAYDSDYSVCGFAAEKKYISSNEFMSLPLVSLEEMAVKFPPCDYEVIVAVTYVKMNNTRERLFRIVKDMGYKCGNYISSKSLVWNNVLIGENVIIMEGANVQYGSIIHDNVVIWPLASVGHQTEVMDNNWIVSGACIGGLSQIGKNCFLGMNSVVKPFTKLAEYSLVGAGVYVNKDTEKYSVYAEKEYIDILENVEDKERMQQMLMIK